MQDNALIAKYGSFSEARMKTTNCSMGPVPSWKLVYGKKLFCEIIYNRLFFKKKFYLSGTKINK